MQVNCSGLRKMRTIVQYRAQQQALEFLSRILTDERGIALLHGPSASGKTVVARRFAHELRPRLAVAIVDGARTNSADLLRSILEQFGLDVSLLSTEDLMNTFSTFVAEQTRSNESPILILENITEMYPSALAMVSKMASLMTESQYAMRFVLVSNRDMSRIVSARSMASVYERIIGDFKLGPMTPKEATRYLYLKLRSGGVQRPDEVLPIDTCEKLHSMSAGWPGDLDTVAIHVIEQAYGLPIRVTDIPDPDEPLVDTVPKIIVTQLGKTLQEVRLTEKRLLIGRSDLSDIVIRDQFVSNQHALLIRDQNAVVIVDLKSRNGTFVNSRRIQGKVLLNDDIASIGDHRLKMVYAAGHASINVDDPDLAETSKWQNIADARRAKERSIPTLVPVVNKKA